MGKSGDSRRISRQMPTSWTMAASTPGGDDGAEILFRLGHFVGENERVEGDVALDAAAMEEFHQLGQIGLGEIMGAHAGVEAFEAEVDGVRAVFDGGLGAIPIARRREQFGRTCAVGTQLVGCARFFSREFTRLPTL